VVRRLRHREVVDAGGIDAQRATSSTVMSCARRRPKRGAGRGVGLIRTAHACACRREAARATRRRVHRTSSCLARPARLGGACAGPRRASSASPRGCRIPGPSSSGAGHRSRGRSAHSGGRRGCCAFAAVRQAAGPCSCSGGDTRSRRARLTPRPYRAPNSAALDVVPARDDPDERRRGYDHDEDP
jgi:hypothetical protein